MGKISKNDGENSYFAGYTPVGYQQITSLASATPLTVPVNAVFANIQVEAQNVRWRDDGSSPTTSVGMQLTIGSYFWYTGDLTKIKFIEVVAGAKLNVSYYQ